MKILKDVDVCNIKQSDLSEAEKMQVVSFERQALEKYENIDEYTIELNENVGVLSSKKDGWSLQIDVQECFFNTFLYKFIMLPEQEKKYLMERSIAPETKPLSEPAYRRWIRGIP